MSVVMCENKTEKLFRPFENSDSPPAPVPYSDEEQDRVNVEDPTPITVVETETLPAPQDTVDVRQADLETGQSDEDTSNNSPKRNQAPHIDPETYNSDEKLGFKFAPNGVHLDLPPSRGTDSFTSVRHTHFGEDYERILERAKVVTPACHSQCLCCAQFCRNFTKSFHSTKLELNPTLRQRSQSSCVSPPYTQQKVNSGKSSPEQTEPDHPEGQRPGYRHLAHLQRIRDLHHFVRQNNKETFYRVEEDLRHSSDSTVSPNKQSHHTGSNGVSNISPPASSSKDDSLRLDHHNDGSPSLMETPSKRRRYSEDSLSGDRGGTTSDGEEFSFDFEAGECIEYNSHNMNFQSVYCAIILHNRGQISTSFTVIK